MTTDFDEFVNSLYRDSITYARKVHAELWASLHPRGQALLSTEITLEVLLQLDPEAREALRLAFPDEVRQALEAM